MAFAETVDLPDGSARPRRITIEGRFIYRAQKRHFLLLDVLPNLLAISAIALAVFWRHPGWPALAALWVMWLVTGFGITVGYHRLFTHKAFETKPWVQAVLGVAGSMAGQGGVISWVAIHRRHHQLSDREGDPHSPNLAGGGFNGRVRGIAHSHFLWMRRHAYPNPSHFAKDLLRNQTVVAVSRRYYLWVLIGVLLPGIAVGLIERSFGGFLMGSLWGGAVRLALLGNVVWAINSFLHCFGDRKFETSDNSRNSTLLGLFTFGESFHNSHHAHPRSALFGLGHPRLDPGFWFIKGLSWAGLATNVYVPDGFTATKPVSVD